MTARLFCIYTDGLAVLPRLLKSFESTLRRNAHTYHNPLDGFFGHLEDLLRHDGRLCNLVFFLTRLIPHLPQLSRDEQALMWRSIVTIEPDTITPPARRDGSSGNSTRFGSRPIFNEDKEYLSYNAPHKLERVTKLVAEARAALTLLQKYDAQRLSEELRLKHKQWTVCLGRYCRGTGVQRPHTPKGKDNSGPEDSGSGMGWEGQSCIKIITHRTRRRSSIMRTRCFLARHAIRPTVLNVSKIAIHHILGEREVQVPVVGVTAEADVGRFQQGEFLFQGQ
ncbi:hypothetical protein B0H13DRAFT_1876717 [Mycena leptocephala]|nr:hypothetical protein B0H13DRAFT_1876717 [Mycena leptocephala]